CRGDLVKQMNEIGAQPDEKWIEEGTDPAFYTDLFASFLVTRSGLIIKFPAYQVGPYAAGNFSVNIPYDLFKGYINPQSIIADY
ncbi:MAG: RsiV family protein, partial [Actinobacteria bacterium]|nr:RsiV family protein [Actinomycetota bacterium]